MKIAIVHDDLMRRGGAEQVALCFHDAFPDAPIYTLAYDPQSTYSGFKNSKIISSWFQIIAKDENRMKKLFFPFGILAMKSLVLNDYDVVLMSTTYCAKYVTITNPNTKIICYCHHPFRLLWYPESYSIYNKSSNFKKVILNTILSVFRKIDFKSAQKIQHFIANTSITREKIAKCYKKDISTINVVFPAVDSDRFYISRDEEVKDYYLIVSRLEYYKMVHTAIMAFNELGLPLIVVGKGTQEEELKKIAKPNIKFLKGVATSDLVKLYSECQAFIFPQLEDYGITALEANASGRPVIAYGQGGVLDTMIPYKDDTSPFTALFFQNQTPKALEEAVLFFQKIKGHISPTFIKSNAGRYDKKNFINTIKNYVGEVYTR